MIKYLKIALKVFLGILILAFLHYNLPDRDIVKVVGTDVKRVDHGNSFWKCGGADAGTKEEKNRDVRYINTERPNGDQMVYCNEDTGWGWPPYFKFDTSDLTSQAQSLANRDDKGEEVWVAVKHYGWRIKLFTMHPNVISIKEVDGPNTRLIPWFNIAFLTILALIFLWIWSRVRRFKQKRIDPITEKVGDGIDVAGNKISSVSGELKDKDSGFRRFMRRWFGNK